MPRPLAISLSAARLLRLALALGLLVVLAGLRPALAGADMPYGQGLLWRIERPGVAPSHLFGTIHVTDPRVLDLPGPVRAAFESSKSATFEVVMDDSVRMKLAHAMVLTDGRTLDGLVERPLYQRTVDAAAKYGLPAEQLRHLKPWAIAMILSVPQEELLRSASGVQPLDQYLQGEARRLGIPLFGLETVEEQIGLFNDLSAPDQAAVLSSAVDQNAEIATLFEDLTRQYLAGDLAAIHASMEKQSKDMDPRFVEVFLLRFNDARNRTMVERMAPRLAAGGAFIAVGALHLPGEKGLLSLLAEQGYSVSRVY